MANDTAQPSQTFIPRTVAQVERGVDAIVARFADPVRDLGNRTLAFVDRLFSARLAADITSPVVQQSVGGGQSMVYPSPWYSVGACMSTRQRPSRTSD